MTPNEKSFYDKGFADAVADRRERDRLETEQIYRQCTREASPLAHYKNMEIESEAIAKDRERRAA